MPFKKGNTEAAKKGKHEKTKQWEELSEAIVNRHTARFNSLLDAMEDKDFKTAYLEALEYFKPKLARTQVEHSGELNHEITHNFTGNISDLKTTEDEPLADK